MPMYLGDASAQRRKQIIGGISAALILFFLIAFWNEIGDVLAVTWNLIKTILSSRPLGNWATEAQIPSIYIITYTCGLGFFAIFFSWLVLLAAQAILPAEGFVEKYRTAWHLLLFMLKRHGMAVFVRDGKINKTKEDDRAGPGVAVVDFNSAIVLETRTPLPGITRMFFNVVHTLLQMVGLAEKLESPRTVGPGVVFTGRTENIRGAADLRKQFRSQPNITAYTRDGIEVSTRVFSIFTIGQPADILQVTYDGDPRPENLRVVTLEPVPEGHFRVTGMADDLERNDRDEIHHHIHVVQRNDLLYPYSDPPDTNTPPEYDRERVFAAIFSEARTENEKSLPWSELPSRVAASIFRELISQVNYNQLYDLKGAGISPLPQYKSRLRLAMRNSGILRYRLLFHRSKLPIERRKTYLRSDFLVSDIKSLVYPKILRERGIKVMMAGFGDILPVNDAIYLHRLESWKATWLRDTDIITAEKELEAMRIRSRARALAQQDIVTSLNHILGQTDIPQEVLAVRVLQALETLASESGTKNLLPFGTLDVIKATREWFLPGSANTPTLPPPVDGDSLV